LHLSRSSSSIRPDASPQLLRAELGSNRIENTPFAHHRLAAIHVGAPFISVTPSSTLPTIMSTTKKESEHSYYPGSKSVYDEPNKAQATGKASFNKSSVDVSDSAVVTARDGSYLRIFIDPRSQFLD